MPTDTARPDAGPVSPHGSFAFEVVVDAPPGEVWQAIVRGERRGRWLRLPGRPGPEAAVDLEPGAAETLTGGIPIGDAVQRLERTTHVVDLDPGRRAVLAYRTVVDGVPRWAALLTVHLEPAGAGTDDDRADDRADDGADDRATAGSTRLTWTEQYAFLAPPGPDDVAHLRGGTRLLLTALSTTVSTTTPRPARELPPDRGRSPVR